MSTDDAVPCKPRSRREVPDGISDLSRELTDGFMGGQDLFNDVLRAGMRQTLDRIKVAAEA